MFHVKHKKHENVEASDELIAEKLAIEFKDTGIPLSEYQLRQFVTYYHEILSWNRKINLISKHDQTRIIERHFLESAALSLFPELQDNFCVLDLGSGGGFPGVPLKIVRPRLFLTLLDSRRMKVLFLKRLIEILDLRDVEVVCERAETAGPKSSYHHRFDAVVSRAVSALPLLYKWAQPFLKAKGVLVAIKGSDLLEEVRLLTYEYPHLSIEWKSFPWDYSKRAKDQRVVFIYSQ